MAIGPVKIDSRKYETLYLPELGVKAPAACLSLFPQFQKDFEILWKKIIKIDKKKIKLKWNKSLISLAQYFYNLEKPVKYFWEIVEHDFGIKRHTLKHLISENKRRDHSKDSKDYAKIKALLEPLDR